MLQVLGAQPPIHPEAPVIGHPTQEVVGVGLTGHLIRRLEWQGAVVRVDAVSGTVLSAAEDPGRKPADVHHQELARDLALTGEERQVLVVRCRWIREPHQPGDGIEHGSGGVSSGLGQVRPGKSISDHHEPDTATEGYTPTPSDPPPGSPTTLVAAMAVARLEFDPYLSDSERWGFSLAQMAELIIPCLDAAGARSVAEVGAFAGDLTRVLVDWAEGSGARVLAIDPSPQEALIQLDEAAGELELLRKTGLEALAEIPLPDVVIIDGDHNYWTVSRELQTIGSRAAGADLPVLLFHDVCWPHGRRDDYFDAESIPAGDRQPVAGGAGGLVPGNPGLYPGGLPYPRSAASEGGPRNGVLTAVEDFVKGRPDLRLVIVPAFFGFGVVWRLGAPFSAHLARILDPWDRNPILQRLEASRVHHLAQGHVRRAELWTEEKRRSRQETLLRRLLDSSAFAVAERLSRLRVQAGVAPAQSVISKDEIRRVLAD